MKRYLTILLLLNVVAMTASAREVFPINEGWRFFFKSEKTSDNARHVTLPHSWNTDPLAQGYWLETTGSYQNGMYIPVEWASKRLFVKFYGVQSVADLFVNAITSARTAAAPRPSRSKSPTKSVSEATTRCSWWSATAAATTCCPPRPT